ncbi:MAG: DUF1343 domain-containing protein [Breznakibacter sp.]|nr:DUF1343 domain-containing protein [Breznakibacter sp.]
MINRFLTYAVFLLVLSSGCSSQIAAQTEVLKTGASRTELYVPQIKDKRVALVVNNTSLLDGRHLLDTLLAREINVVKVFAPEHGFRGDADAGETIQSAVDKKSGVAILSLYGKSKKPSKESLADVDIVVFDIQDVGVRFYTYISTLKYVMEACAETNKPLIVLDRPNPNGDYIDGPVLDTLYTSFVGIVPIPVVYGTTIGELAMMINGESWLKGGGRCNLTVVPLENYVRSVIYPLSVKPSPNLTSLRSIRLYPSLCFFEATAISVGRGTNYPFEVIGFPNPQYGTFTFTPKSIVGMAKQPLQENKLCYGLDLRVGVEQDRFTLKYLLDFYRLTPDKSTFFTTEKFFNLLAGNAILLKQIKEGHSEEQIKASWQSDLDKYRLIRGKYLLYPDFEIIDNK